MYFRVLRFSLNPYSTGIYGDSTTEKNLWRVPVKKMNFLPGWSLFTKLNTGRQPFPDHLDQDNGAEVVTSSEHPLSEHPLKEARSG